MKIEKLPTKELDELLSLVRRIREVDRTYFRSKELGYHGFHTRRLRDLLSLLVKEKYVAIYGSSRKGIQYHLLNPNGLKELETKATDLRRKREASYSDLTLSTS